MAGWKTWIIYRPNENMGMVGCFHSRLLCREYLKFKKEQHFFETGSMEEAEDIWGEDKFIIDYSYTLTRETAFTKFILKCEDWSHD